MAIPFNNALLWDNYIAKPQWTAPQEDAAPSDRKAEVKRAVHEISIGTITQAGKRGVQFIRDALRIGLKVPIRLIKNPKKWDVRENAKINMKLAGYAFVQLLSVPVKFVVAFAALATLVFSLKHGKSMLDSSADWTARMDGRASQLEALKEQGLKRAANKEEYEAYKTWIYSIDPKLCTSKI
jgi:hypothetical protein